MAFEGRRHGACLATATFAAAWLIGVASIMPAQAGSFLSLLSNTSANQAGGVSAGEIPAFDPNTNRLFITSSGLLTGGNASTGVYRVNIFGISNPSMPTTIGTVDFTTSFGTAADMQSLSSVAVDPLGRFGVAALIPTANTTTVGKVGFFELGNGTVIGTADAGYHPDSVTFSADGSRLVVVNEGEFNASSGTNAPGSISVFDISGINSGNLATLPTLVPGTFDFTSGNLGTGVSLSGIRNSNVSAVGTSGTFIANVPDFTLPANIDPNAIEPEYASIRGSKVYVSLQDNNALGEFDLTTSKWTSVKSLGTITQTVDASDSDGGININDSVRGMPMPDTINSYVVGATTYIVTANEGDARVDDRDVSRFGDISGNDSMNNIVDTDAPSNFPLTQTGARDNSTGLGRLTTSRLDGDTDADSKIDAPTMLGTRSFTIWEQTASGPVLAFDSGSFFEEYLRDNDSAGWVDTRSDDKGPEPEGLTLGTIDGQTYAFIGMERTNGIFMFDITNPLSPVFKDYMRISDGSNTPLRPEGFSFVNALDSPTGTSLLIVGFEGDGSVATSERFAIISVVPEPSTYVLVAAAGAGLVALARRRRQARRGC